MDISAAQNSILELKIAAISHMTYEDYIVLLGEAPGSDNKRYVYIFKQCLFLVEKKARFIFTRNFLSF